MGHLKVGFLKVLGNARNKHSHEGRWLKLSPGEGHWSQRGEEKIGWRIGPACELDFKILQEDDRTPGEGEFQSLRINVFS